MKIKSIEKIESKPVYDIEVADSHHYILDNGVITHNSGVRYANSMTLMLSKSKEKAGDEVVGALIHCKLDKGRITKEQTKIDIKLYFDRGLDKYYGLLDLALKYGIATKAKEGKLNFNGLVASEKSIYGNPTKYFTEETMALLEEAAGKEFKYGMSVELTPEDEEGDIVVDEGEVDG